MSEYFFNLYSKNWEIVKRHSEWLGITILQPLEDDIFLCPLCLSKFSRDDLNLSPSPISLEHLPPIKLGGKPSTLTCRKCNNTSGRYLDAALIKEVQFKDFVSNQPASEVDTRYYVNRVGGIAATLRVSNSGHWQLIDDPKRTDPTNMRKAYQLMGQGGIIEFTLEIPAYSSKMSAIASLRIAYLQAFSMFGYSFIIDSNLGSVREQILYPHKECISTYGMFSRNNQAFPLGMYIITDPPEMRSFLSVFDVISSLQVKTRQAVVLPGPGEPGLKVYDWLATRDEETISISIKGTVEKVDFLRYPFASYEMWNAFR